jgi:serine phosphatase RsbU (regulator of sigma subunit)
MKSAINAVFTSGLLLSRIQTDQPEHILQQVNPILCKKTDSRTFVTCQIGRVDLNTKIMQLANAGHCLPLLKRNGETQFIKTNGPRFPLGMRPNVRYEATEVQLITGDILILYSDGLAEAQNQKGKRLEFDDILKLVNDLPSDTMTAQDICASLKKFILSYSDYELVDDTTVICLKVV